MYRALTTVFVIGSLASPLVSLAAAGQNGKMTRQRIAIEERVDTLTGKGTWRLIPLTPGPISRDSGKVVCTTRVVGTAMREGARVTLIVGHHELTGKRGTITISQEVESADVALGSAYSTDVGAWKLRRGTSACADLHGGGRFAAVGLPSGTVLARQEGWVSS